jgi:uncharacterized membrane protein YjjP (DUF1212 family)
MTLPWGAIRVTVVSSVAMSLAIAASFLRIWSRRLQRQPLAFDDYMALVAIFLAAATVSVFLVGKFTDHCIYLSMRINLGTQLDLLPAWERISSISKRLILLHSHYI